MRVLLQSSFVLHRRPYRDTSLLLEVFSQEYGRLGLVARGAVSPRSRWKGLLQPFAPLLLSWSGAGELATLTAAEEAGCPIPLPPHRVLAGLYINELLLRLLPRLDPHPGLFAGRGAMTLPKRMWRCWNDSSSTMNRRRLMRIRCKPTATAMWNGCGRRSRRLSTEDTERTERKMTAQVHVDGTGVHIILFFDCLMMGA